MGNTVQKTLTPLIGHKVYLDQKIKGGHYGHNGNVVQLAPEIVLKTQQGHIYRIDFDYSIHFLMKGSPLEIITHTIEKKAPLTPNELRDLHDPYDQSLQINIENGKTVILETKEIKPSFKVKTVTPIDERTYSGFWGQMGYPDDPKQKYGYKITDTNNNDYEIFYIKSIRIQPPL